MNATASFQIGDRVKIVLGSQQGMTAKVIELDAWTGADRWVVIELDGTTRTCAIDPAKLAPVTKRLGLGESVTLDRDGDQVKFSIIESAGAGRSVAILKAWERFAMRRTTRVFSVERARREYRKLLAAGYSPW